MSLEPLQSARSAFFLLGASNAARGLATIAYLTEAALSQDLDLYCAIGSGRGYAAASRLLGRGLCGIGDCGLWEVVGSLPRARAARSYAVLADLGNDLAYGATARVVAAAVCRCLDRLPAVPERTAVVLPPVDTVERLPAWQFELARRLLFPTHRIERARLLRELHQLTALLEAERARRGFALVRPLASWYGHDPIHLRRAARAAAWREILDRARVPACAQGAGPRFWRAARLRSGRAERLTLFGRELYTAQPCRRLGGAARVFYY